MQEQRSPKEMPGIAVSEFDNSGLGPLLVPGFSRMPLYVEAEVGKRRFTHAFDDTRHWPMRATAREIAMLRSIEKITDRPSWHEDVFSEKMVSEWKEEATNADWRISDRAWAWCVLELRDKAKHFMETGRIVVLDYATGVCKVDLCDGLSSLLKRAIEEVVENEPDKVRHRPNGIAHIVDSHLAPLVYGQTRVLSEGGVVGMEGMDEWYGRGSLSTRAENLKFHSPSPADARGTPDADAVSRRWDALGTLSPGFQWLPCEVAFTGESPWRRKVQITSYINDLHPHKHAPAYAAIGKVISAAIESWNEILVLAPPSTTLPTTETSGRTPARIKTYGVQYPFGLPSLEVKLREAERLEDSDPANSDKTSLTASLRLVEDEVSKGMVGSRAQVYLNGFPDHICWESSRRLIHPEPGVSFSYQEWKMGRNVTRALFPSHNEGKPEVNHDYYSVSLEDEFRDRGLQVVVHVDSIELTPDMRRFEDEKDEYGDEMWHAADGLVTDYIAATAIVFFDLDNVGPIRMRFQQASHLHESDFSEAEHGDFTSIMEVFDLDYSDWRRNLCQPNAQPRVQELGSVAASEGRMLSFPGPVSYRFDPCELVDASKPGHARYLALYLVDPNYRVCSTRNVSPQRLDWWAYDVARKAPEALGDLPSELFDQIIANSGGDGILDAEGLERVKNTMEEERWENAEAIRDDIRSYRFCYDNDHILGADDFDDD